MSKMNLNIITPEGIIYDDEIERVTIRTIDGDRGILPQHEPLVSGVDIGEIKIKEANEEKRIAASHGYMEVLPQQVTVLVETAEFEHEIDVERAQNAKKRAQQLLEEAKDHISQKKAELTLKKALNRLKVSKGRNFE